MSILIPIYRTDQTEKFMKIYKDKFQQDSFVQELMKTHTFYATIMKHEYKGMTEFCTINPRDTIGNICSINFDDFNICLESFKKYDAGPMVSEAFDNGALLMAYPRTLMAPSVNVFGELDYSNIQTRLITFNIKILKPEEGYDTRTDFSIRILC